MNHSGRAAAEWIAHATWTEMVRHDEDRAPQDSAGLIEVFRMYDACLHGGVVVEFTVRHRSAEATLLELGLVTDHFTLTPWGNFVRACAHAKGLLRSGASPRELRWIPGLSAPE